MITLSNLNFSYQNTLIFKDLAYTFHTGKCYGLVGKNGIGKSTLFKLLLGLLPPQSGTITVCINDQNIALDQLSQTDLAKHIAWVQPIIDISFNFTVFDMLLMGRYPYAPFGNFGKMDIDCVKHIMNEFDLDSIKDTPFSALSSGWQQRVLVARAFAQTPKVLLLDEPLTHLDIPSQALICDMVKKYTRAHNITTLFVSHMISPLKTVCDDILCMDQHNIIATHTKPFTQLSDSLVKIFGKGSATIFS